MAIGLKTDGIIIREQTVGESDRLVSVLTRNNGVIRAFARHAKNPKDNKASSTALLSYSDFMLRQGKNYYYVDTAKPKEVFFGLRENLESLSLAQYFCELAGEFVPEHTESSEFLRLMLNSLYFLSKQSKPAKQIKAITELRMLSLAGYMPNLIGCRSCHEYEKDLMYFLPLDASLVCSDCFTGESPSIALNKTELHVLRHICFSDFEKIYSFSVPEGVMNKVAEACEFYAVNTLGRRMKTLDFYKSMLF